MIWIVIAVLVLPFGYVLVFGAPYLPTRKKQAVQALDMLGLKKGEIFVDLGCGDGAVLIEAARRGLVCYGYELNPLVFLVAYIRTFRYRRLIKIRMRNFWSVTLPENTKGVFVFLLDKYMDRLDQKLQAELKDGRLVSYTFQIPNRTHESEKDALYIYKY